MTTTLSKNAVGEPVPITAGRTALHMRPTIRRAAIAGLVILAFIIPLVATSFVTFQLT